MKKYVAGFLFNLSGQRVALIRKIRPDWQKGKLNAIGGKIEKNETPLKAMIREFKEEAGVEITDWREFCFYDGGDSFGYGVHFFSALTENIFKVKTMEDEKVETFWVDDLVGYEMKIYNLNWLIPMALDQSLSHSIVVEKKKAGKL